MKKDRQRTPYEEIMLFADQNLEPGVAYFINIDSFKWYKPVYRFSLITKILHLFGRHIYVWNKKKCIYPGCKKE